MVNLKAKPFYLSDEQVHWVENSIAGMTLEEKLGQLFVILQAQPGFGEKQVEALLDKSHMGGLRWQNGGNKQQIYNQLTTFQKHTKIPLLIAANCDDGGNGAAPEGTFVATAVECGAGQGTENAYHVGLVAGREASALGANWMFNPVVDVYKNWRNTIVNTRAFSSDPDTVIANARAYIKGIKDANPNMACTAKHFPGDGVEELDQHLAMGVNSLSVEDWEASFGKVYRTLINEGLEAIMVGHIRAAHRPAAGGYGLQRRRHHRCHPHGGVYCHRQAEGRHPRRHHRGLRYDPLCQRHRRGYRLPQGRL